MQYAAHFHTEVATPNLAEGDQVFGNATRQIDGHRKPVALVAPTLRGDSGYDTNHLPVEIHQRAARRARVDGCVGLDEVLDGELVADDIEATAPDGRHDALRDRVAKTEWTADGKYPLPHLHIVRVPQRHHRQRLRVVHANLQQADHCQVRGPIQPHDLCLKLALVVQPHPNAACP